MGGKLKILIVDDDKRMARTLKDVLRANDFVAEAVFSGTECLEMIKENSFGCVLSDIKMPGMSGVDLCRQIKAKWPGMPIVLMTAYSTDKQVKEGLEEGAIAALPKPLDINNLLKIFSGIIK